MSGRAMGAQRRMHLGLGVPAPIGAGTLMLADGEADKDDSRVLLGP
jgi:hypothetical protein